MKLKITDHIDGNAVRVAEIEGEGAADARAALIEHGAIDGAEPWITLVSRVDPNLTSSKLTQYTDAAALLDSAKECAALATALVGETLHSDTIVLDWEDWPDGGASIDEWPDFAASGAL